VVSISFPFLKPERERECVAKNEENFTFLYSSRGCIKKELFVKFYFNSKQQQICSSWSSHIWSTPGARIRATRQIQRARSTRCGRHRMNHEAGKTNRKRKRPAAFIQNHKQQLHVAKSRK
jgi:hypothetical protein